jgi:hypothetical protein
VEEYETDDLAFAAYLKAKAEVMTRHRAGRGKMVWYFADEKTKNGTKISDRLTEFLNSPEKLFDSFCRDLKKMLRKQLLEG